jgi:hypothetical protein
MTQREALLFALWLASGTLFGLAESWDPGDMSDEDYQKVNHEIRKIAERLEVRAERLEKHDQDRAG